jgi:lipoprotein NlpI
VFRDERRFAFALQALARRDFASAEVELSRLLAEQSLAARERAFLLNKRGVARVGLEVREPARDDFIAALEAYPAFAPALTNLGNLSLEDGKVEAAIEFYQRAIAGDRDYAIAYLNLGVAFKRAGRIAEGVRALREAHRLERRANAANSWWRVRRR